MVEHLKYILYIFHVRCSSVVDIGKFTVVPQDYKIPLLQAMAYRGLYAVLFCLFSPNQESKSGYWPLPRVWQQNSKKSSYIGRYQGSGMITERLNTILLSFKAF